MNDTVRFLKNVRQRLTNEPVMAEWHVCREFEGDRLLANRLHNDYIIQLSVSNGLVEYKTPSSEAGEREFEDEDDAVATIVSVADSLNTIIHDETRFYAVCHRENKYVGVVALYESRQEAIDRIYDSLDVDVYNRHGEEHWVHPDGGDAYYIESAGVVS